MYLNKVISFVHKHKFDEFTSALQMEQFIRESPYEGVAGLGRGVCNTVQETTKDILVAIFNL